MNYFAELSDILIHALASQITGKGIFIVNQGPHNKHTLFTSMSVTPRIKNIKITIVKL